MRRSADLDYCFDSPAPESTFELAALLGRAIGSRGLVVGLIGPLGAGKTCFVKGLAEGLGLDSRIVSSPTFAIAQQYRLPEGPELLHHLDLYRLESEAELESLGLSDWLAPGQVVAVEWLDRFPESLGTDRLEVRFAPSSAAASAPPGDEEEGDAASRALCEVDTRVRRLELSAFGAEATRVLRDLVHRCERLAEESPVGRPEAGGRSPRRTRDGIGTLALLLAAGWIGVDALSADGAGSDRLACAALEPATPAGFAPVDARDALGPLAVACGDPIGARVAAPSARPGTPALDGIAQLLDGGVLDPNTATAALLAQLPGLGAARAAAIVETRARSPFVSLEDLERVPGIGPKTRAGLEPFLAVDSKRRPG